MADTPSKRLRDEAQLEDLVVDETNKRRKSYNHILSLLDEEEDEPPQGLSSLITTLQQELSSHSSTFDDLLSAPTTAVYQEHPTVATTTTVQDYPSSSSSTFLKEEEEDDRERVIRHLLEASDDELGIPNTQAIGGVEDGYGETVGNSENGFINGVDGFSLCDGLWELEDANANYYALLQSELFL